MAERRDRTSVPALVDLAVTDSEAIAASLRWLEDRIESLEGWMDSYVYLERPLAQRYWWEEYLGALYEERDCLSMILRNDGDGDVEDA